MAKRENKAMSLKDILPQMLETHKLTKGMDQIAVKDAWGQVMGNGVLAYTDQVLLKNKTLWVKLNSAALREELSFGKEKIMEMMNSALRKPLIESIKLM